MTPLYEMDYLDDPDAALQHLMAIDWVQRPDAPRKEYWDTTKGKAYTYGQGRGVRTYEPNTPDPIVADIREWLLLDLGVDFQGCFLNRYDTSKDWLGWHADDDPGIDHSKPIAVVTLGAGREINWKLKEAKGVDAIHKQFLSHGSLFIMPAGMQDTHFHRIPKADRPVETRISLTFRSLL